MKKCLAFLLICLALVLCTGAALAEDIPPADTEQPHLLEGKLISRGDFPQNIAVKSGVPEGLEEYIVARLNEGAAEIDIYSFGVHRDVFADFYWDMLNSRPELFFVDGSLSYWDDSNGIVKRFAPAYLFSGQELQDRIAEFEGYVDEIVRFASAASTPLGQMLLVNDYFCVNYEYDLDYQIYRPDELFTGKTGVCQAYMLAYAAVLNELEIPNTYAVSDSMNHIWNVVQLDGDWYHVDVTWNDPVEDVPLRARHYYFLLSDEAFLKGGHYDWTSSVAADSSKYDSAFWRSLDVPLPVVDENIYHFNAVASTGKRIIYCWNAVSGKTAEICSVNLSSFSYAGFMGLAAKDGLIYFSAGNELRGVGAGGGASVVLHTLQDAKAQIWSAWRSGDTLQLYAGRDLDSSKIVSIPIPAWSAEITVLPELIHLDVGETAPLKLAAAGDTSTVLSGKWLSSDSSVATVNQQGAVTGRKMGITEIRAFHADGYADASVVVHADKKLVLPEEITAIAEEAFAGVSAIEIVIPFGVQSVGAKAFENCADLRFITIPETVVSIAEDAFRGCGDDLIIFTPENSAACAFAMANNIRTLPSE